MIIYLLKTLVLLVILFLIIRVSLAVLLKDLNEDKLVKVSISLTGIIGIFYILVCGNMGGYEGFEEVENAQTAEQNKQIEENVEEDLQKLLNEVMEKDDTKEDIIEDGPKPTLNSSEVIIDGISDEENKVEESKDIAVRQPTVEESAEPLPMPTEIKEHVEKQDQIDQKIAAKYTILPIDQWMKPNSIDIINATSCSCPTVAPFSGSYLEYK